MMKPLLTAVAAGLVLSAAPAVQAQQGEGEKAAPAQLSPDQVANIQRAAVILRLFNLTFTSKEVKQPVKNKLMQCLYNNKLADISAAAKRVIDQNPALSEDKSADVYRAAAGVCGVTFAKADEAGPAGTTGEAGKGDSPSR